MSDTNSPVTGQMKRMLSSLLLLLSVRSFGVRFSSLRSYGRGAHGKEIRMRQ